MMPFLQLSRHEARANWPEAYMIESIDATQLTVSNDNTTQKKTLAEKPRKITNSTEAEGGAELDSTEI